MSGCGCQGLGATRLVTQIAGYDGAGTTDSAASAAGIVVPVVAGVAAAGVLGAGYVALEDKGESALGAGLVMAVAALIPVALAVVLTRRGCPAP